MLAGLRSLFPERTYVGWLGSRSLSLVATYAGGDFTYLPLFQCLSFLVIFTLMLSILAHPENVDIDAYSLESILVALIY